MFLRDNAPEVLKELGRGLALATVRCSCDYLSELTAFDQVIVRMRLGGGVQNRISRVFEDWRQSKGGEDRVARIRREGEKTVPTAIPVALREALKPYA